jgi:putative flippase GtrA
VLDARFARFLLVGIANTGAGLGVIYAAKFWGGFGDVAANVLGYGVGLALSFVLNRTWTFGHTGSRAAALGRFLVVVFVAYAANLGTVLLTIEVLHVDGYWAQPWGMIPYTLLSYLGSRHWAFVEQRGHPDRV